MHLFTHGAMTSTCLFKRGAHHGSVANTCAHHVHDRYIMRIQDRMTVARHHIITKRSRRHGRLRCKELRRTLLTHRRFALLATTCRRMSLAGWLLAMHVFWTAQHVSSRGKARTRASRQIIHDLAANELRRSYDHSNDKHFPNKTYLLFVNTRDQGK